MHASWRYRYELSMLVGLIGFGALFIGCGGGNGAPIPVELTPSKSPDDGRNGIGKEPTGTDYTNRIVFSASPDGSGNDEIYTINPDGTNILRLTETTAADREPSWSPDKKHIVYTSTQQIGQKTKDLGLNLPQRADIWLMDANGLNKSQLFRADEKLGYRYAAYPRFSPDGKTIVAVVYKDFNPDAAEVTMKSTLLLIDVTSHIREEISDLGGVPAWSPDGKKIVFAARDANSARFLLYVLDVESHKYKAITDPPTSQKGNLTHYGADTNPVWNTWQGEEAICFTRTYRDDNPPRTVELYRVKPDGTSLAKIAENATGRNYGLAFSPDGQRLLVTRQDDASLYTMNRDGTGEMALTIGTGLVVGAADW